MKHRLPGRLVLLGHPVAHSLSPAFQNAALEAASIPIRYEALDVAGHDLDRVVASLRAEDTWGNVTVPYKERMRDACDVVTSVAERASAVNTFWVDGTGRLVGDNTDVGGFSAAVFTLLGESPHGLTVGGYGWLEGLRREPRSVVTDLPPDAMQPAKKGKRKQQ